MAILDLLLQMYPCSLPKSIPINALLIADNKTLAEQVDDLLLKGFSSIKIKVARQPIKKDIEDISNVLAKIQSKALLRLDANRQWTLSQAKQFCDAVDPQGIEYIEEPTQNPADHISLSKCTNIPIALDETLPDFLEASISSQNFGSEYSSNSRKSAQTSLSRTTASMCPFLSTSRTIPSSGNGNFSVLEDSCMLA